VALQLKSQILAYHYLVKDDEEDEGLHVMGQLGLSASDMGATGAALMLQGQATEVYKGDMGDAAALKAFAEEFMAAQGEFTGPASGGGNAKKASSKKKKRSKKSEM